MSRTATATAPVTFTEHGKRPVGHFSLGLPRPLATEATAEVLGRSFSALVLASGKITSPCWKCGGSGLLDHYLGIYDGVCFACRGFGTQGAPLDREEAEKRFRTKARREIRADEKRAAEAAEMAEKAAELEAARRAQEEAEEAARQAELAKIDYLGEVGDKVTLTGTLRAAMTVDGYAYGSTQRFLVIAGDGFVAKAYTSALWAYGVEKGETVTLTATVKAQAIGRDDERLTVLKAPKLAKS